MKRSKWMARFAAEAPLSVRIALIPAVAALGFLITLAAIQLSADAGQRRLEIIHEGYGPSLTTSRDMATTFTTLQRALQDAVTIAELEALSEADSLAARLRGLLAAARANPVNDPMAIDSLRHGFDAYYRLVRTASVDMIENARAPPDLPRLRAIREGYNALQARLGRRIGADEERIAEALADVIRFQEDAAIVSAVVLLVFVLGLAALASHTWRRVHHALARVHEAASAIAGGDLDRSIRFQDAVDIRELTGPFQAIVHYIRDIADAADRLARGDTSVRIEPRSERDRIARDIRRALDARTSIEGELRSAEEQARHAQKMEAVGRLAGGIAHDFNNLLTAIGGHASLALDRLDGHPAAADVVEVQGAADRAAGLTRQLLAYSRKQVLHTRVTDMNRVVDETVRMMRPIIGEHIEITVRPESHPWPVVIDPGQIEQALVNLLVNARDAMVDGGRVTIETRNVELGSEYRSRRPAVELGDYVLLSVTDTGPGIPAEVRDRIFEPFFTTKPQGKGTGLGLSMVYGLVKQSDGEIWVYSEEGKGTTFKLYFPRGADQLPDDPEDTVGGNGARPTDGTERILLVEDDPAVRGLARKVLSRHGYDTLEAADGASAIEAFDQLEGIDLLITDVVMPGMSGWELATALRERQPTLRVLFMSGYSAAVVEKPDAFHTELDYLEKPFTPAAFAMKVREILDAAPLHLV